MTSNQAAHDELLLIERVFLRIGSASQDDILEAELCKFLPPIILKLSSPSEAVRKKVMELLIHVNRRVKDIDKIQLPVEALIKQYQDPASSSFVTNFSIIYIKMGYPRMEQSKQVELLPMLINCLEGKPAAQQDSLLFLMMPVFGLIKLPETREKTESFYNLRNRGALMRLLSDFMLDVLLLPYGATPLTVQGQQPPHAEGGGAPPIPGIPAGMSIGTFKRVCSGDVMKAEDLEKVKVSIVKFLSAEVLPPPLVAHLLIVAAADTRFSVANVAEMTLRRLDSSFDWNNSGIIAAMYVLFLGTLTPKDKTPHEKFKNPANTRIRLKLMPFLLKSKEAGNYAPLAVKVFYECVWGPLSNSKLKQQGVMFLHHVSYNADKEKLLPVGGVLFQGVVKVIEEETQDARVRSLAYGALAKLSLKLPNLLLSHKSQLHYLQTLMDALIKEEGDVLMAVQEALSMVAPVCKKLTSESQAQLCILLLEHVSHQNVQLRRTAVQYAATVFSREHVASRFILLIATGDSQDEIRLDAKHQLFRAESENKDGIQNFETPPFVAMCNYVSERIKALPKANWMDVANQPLPFPLRVMDQILLYLEHCLSIEATGKKCSTDMGLMWDDSPTIGKFLSSLLDKCKSNSKKDSDPLEQFLGFCELAANAWSSQALKSILRIVAVVPQCLAKRNVNSAEYLTDYLKWIKKYVIRGGHHGEVAAHLYGVVAGQIIERDKFDKVLNSITKIKELRVDSQESCILGQGYSLCYQLHGMKLRNANFNDWPMFNSVVVGLVQYLVQDRSILQNCAAIAIGEIARQAPLPLVYELEKSNEDSDVNKPTLNVLFDTLKKIYYNTKSTSKIREQAITTMGYLCVGQPDCPLKLDIIQSFLGLAREASDLEIHFAVGEALADCILGQDASSARNLWMEADDGGKSLTDIKEEEKMEVESVNLEEIKDSKDQPMADASMEIDSSTQVEKEAPSDSDGNPNVSGSLEWLLYELLKKYVGQTHPGCKQASCLWLLAVLKKCREKPAIQKYLSNIQSAFMNLLADSNDLIQDAASRGLGVVYECCSQETRQKMVEGLVDTLTDGKRTVANVTQDTKIFEEGEMGKAPSGGQLSTYKELCSLATDLNQPELIYKFMNLANHNAIWNSKKGAAFGFGTLASQAGAQLEPYLPQIIPKLYRYQHDPTPRIQQPMSAIWNSLVKDSSKTIEKYYDTILSDLLTNITHTMWRVRESCCNALTDLLRRQPVTSAKQHISEIWMVLFRVRDDIKESVRLSAEKTLQCLSKSCIKVCENHGQGSESLLENVLPILLTTGISSTVIEVRGVSIQTLVKLCRSGGSLIKPHLGTLVPAFLEALSGLEHEALSYTSVRMDDENRERLDTARVMAAKSTPMMDTINYVLQFIDEEVLSIVVSGVVDIIKRSVGLSSRAGAAHVIETLTHICPIPLEKHTGKILTALVNGLIDRNPVIRKVFASAIGNLVKTAKASSVDKLLDKLQSWYLEKEDDSIKLSAAMAMRSMHTQNADIMKNYSKNAMPLVFLAMHGKKSIDGEDPTGVEIWEDIWNENTPGTEAGVKLYLNEIISICEISLQSSNWAAKAQAGRSLSTVSEKLGRSLTESQILRLISLLIMGLQGRTWDGKEALVQALSNVSLNTISILRDLKVPESGNSLFENILNVLTREAKKEKMEYKIHSLKALTVVLDAYKVDRFVEVYEICLPHLALDKENIDDSDPESQQTAKERSLHWELVDELIHSLGRAWPSTKQTQETYSEQLVEMLSLSITRVPRKTQLSIVKALREFWAHHFMLEGLPETLDHVLLGALVHFTCKIYNFSLGVAKFYSLRREALVVLNEFLEKSKESSVLIGRIRADLLPSIEEAKRDSQPDIQAFASTAYKILIADC